MFSTLQKQKHIHCKFIRFSTLNIGAGDFSKRPEQVRLTRKEGVEVGVGVVGPLERELQPWKSGTRICKVR